MKRKSQFITPRQLSSREIPANCFVTHVPRIFVLESLIFRIFLSHTYNYIGSKPCCCTGLCINIGSCRKSFQMRFLDLLLPLHAFCNYFFLSYPSMCNGEKKFTSDLGWILLQENKVFTSHLPESSA